MGRGSTASLIVAAVLGAALVGLAGYDLWRLLWLDETWRLVRGGTAAALGGVLIGLAMQRRAAAVLLIAASVVVALIAAYGLQTLLGRDVATAIETRVLRAKTLARTNREMEELAVRPIDLRPRPEVIASLARAGIEAWPPPIVFTLGHAVDAGVLPFHPLSGIANAWITYCNEGDQPATPIDRSDRFGFNNADTVYALPRDRIVLLGDSYVWGACVHQEQTIAGHLRRQGFAAVSLGIGGNGPLSNLAILREYGATMAPKLVVWFHTDGNDIDDLRDTEIRSAAFRRYADPNFRQGLAARQAEVDALWKPIFTDNPALYRRGLQQQAPPPVAPQDIEQFARALGVDNVRGLGDDEAVRIAVGLIRAARNEAVRLGARFLFVPIRPAPLYRSTYRLKYLDRVLDGVRQAGIEVVDPDLWIRDSGNPSQFFPETHENPHYNARGYGLLADLVRRALLRPGGIRIVEATLGRSCLGVDLPPPAVNSVRIGNLTRALVARCTGEQACTLPLIERDFIGDPASGCASDVEATWRCDGQPGQQRFYIAPGQITADSAIRLACPAAPP